ncbi:pyridoxamine 5'-phosphate oxidase [Tenacibaculum sp. M341]|uniref:pyridoxamine 5'-phosphate oxidase n=1 Tax=Tenacibaculum sp. M341 TaxID=2530339 RepID=UPI00104575AD|nr:pyridoxamine 5'-phosphate oxidase [Tenacibaculum sp. M341]TCI92632.1 pyridoxamine 5'-phosphate oxidase [Tenacibaculum sp. M341]
MNQDLSDYRKSYEKFELVEDKCPDNPITLFENWFAFADASETVEEANAMNISTIGLDGFPKNRVVLLKQFSNEGFIFYTNYNSEKGKAIANNPNVCLSFFWPSLERQIIIKGQVAKVTEEVSDTYFNSRPKGSRLGAWASNQSEVVASRVILEDALKAKEEEYEEKEVVRPKHWGGYIAKPVSIEFWQGRPNRMHDRVRYQLEKDFSWKLERLAP